MINWIMYDASGEILRSGSCNADVNVQVDPNLTFMIGTGTNLTHYVLNGVITAYTDVQFKEKSSGNNYFGKWSNTTFSYVDQRPQTEITNSIISTYEASAQTLIDSLAQSWGYDSLNSAASYITSGVPKFKAESLTLIAYRDAVWVAAIGILDAVKASTQQIPTDSSAFIALLPAAPVRPT